MRGIWLEDGKLRYRDDIPRPVPKAGEALVKVLRAGLCSTDTAMIQGLNPFSGVLGHEFTGVVSDGPIEWMHKPVVSDINASCGACADCQNGRRKHCPNRTVVGIIGRDGVFAEYVALPLANLHAVPEGVSPDQAVFTEPLAAALDVLDAVDVGAGDRVLLVGAGKLGQLIARVLCRTGCDLTVVVRREAKRARLQGLDVQIVEPDAVTGSAGDGNYDVAVECTGNPDGLRLALSAVKPRGTVVLKSTYPAQVTLDATSLVVDEKRLVGSRCGPFDEALDLLASGDINVEALIDGVFPLADVERAFTADARPETVKVLLDPQAEP